MNSRAPLLMLVNHVYTITVPSIKQRLPEMLEMRLIQRGTAVQVIQPCSHYSLQLHRVDSYHGFAVERYQCACLYSVMRNKDANKTMQALYNINIYPKGHSGTPSEELVP